VFQKINQIQEFEILMDSDRKYRQNGYLSSNNTSSSHSNGHDNARPKPAGPRPPIDITGPRLPRLVQTVTASRCYNCSTALMPGLTESVDAACPKCGVQLHCCKQCSYFEPSTRFQCTKPVPVRIAAKDQRNECTLFKPRMTVAREATSAPNGNGHRNGATTLATPPPRNASDARDAFDRLFKK
jgi:hypothetical protein